MHGSYSLVMLNDINSLPPKDKEALLLNIDAFLCDAKTRQAYVYAGR
jgi:hypothetical protein